MKHKWPLFTLAGIIIVFDQVSKYWAEKTLILHSPQAVITDFFNVTLVYNRGAAFSFLSDASGWQRWFFIILTLAVCSFLLLWIKRLPQRLTLEGISLALVLGGAIGNFIDRVIMGHVIDFIDLYYQHWHWPAFNIADSAITVGAIMLAITTFKKEA